MKAVHLYLIIILLYLTIPVIGLGFLGTMVTKEYQVKQAMIFTEIDEEKMNQADFKSELEEIKDLEKEVQLTQISLIGFGLIFFPNTDSNDFQKTKNNKSIVPNLARNS